MTYSYQAQYQHQQLRGREEKRPWNLTDILLNFSAPNKILLDVGCGTAIKLLPLANAFSQIIGVDPNPAMLERAKKNFKEAQYKNFSFLQGDARCLPIENESVDIVTAMIAVHTVTEIYRILKPGGIVIIEDSGERDKAELKKFFQDEKNKPRGQWIYLPEDAIATLNHNMYQSVFTDVTTKEGFWNAYFSEDELFFLLNHTPIIKNFSLPEDQQNLNNAMKELLTPQGIKITHHRILTLAKKQDTYKEGN